MEPIGDSAPITVLFQSCCNNQRSNKTNRTIDLPVLNEARGKLLGAQKVTVYVGENVFLTTKWTSNEIDLGFIDLRRID